MEDWWAEPISKLLPVSLLAVIDQLYVRIYSEFVSDCFTG